ncbi:hypothetical protein SAMN04488135_12017 [Pollutimonas bauzanensis]|uniref:Uncharacterized protein n=1 Tax=Pollutimonas bauzanensis TaxID=658167 RepID=A0A1M5ZX27_9BURK|nr:hypothetical protein SAMN04488135_12017 [Pollutimonas bauzanensis]
MPRAPRLAGGAARKTGRLAGGARKARRRLSGQQPEPGVYAPFVGAPQPYRIAFDAAILPFERAVVLFRRAGALQTHGSVGLFSPRT